MAPNAQAVVTPGHRSAVAQRKVQPKRSSEPLWFVLLLCGLYWLWQQRELQLLSAEHGLGYVMGIVAVSAMLLLLIYPLRKRLRFLALLGPVRRWFQIHMWLGVLAPSAALVHCNFQLGSLNSQIALFSALLVAASGLVGRVLYRKIHQSLYGRKTDLNSLKAALLEPQRPHALFFFDVIHQRLRRLDAQIIGSGQGLLSSFRLTLFLRFRLRRERRALVLFAQRQIDRRSVNDPVIHAHRDHLLTSVDRYLFGHMFKLRKIARIQTYERLFALWHVVHLPFFVLLVLSVVAHVFAVHLY